MTARVVRVSGERLSEFLSQPRGPLARVEVAPPPRQWAPLKPALALFARRYRDSGTPPPSFSGVPLCLFGSEWPGFGSSPRAAPARGRCVDCQARDSCGFGAEVPDELLPLSAAPLPQRWRDYAAAFRRVTGSDMADAATATLDKIVASYRGPVSLEPSVLVSDAVDPSLRFVVFPHRAGAGAAARAQYEEALACAAGILADLGSVRSAALIGALARLPPSPVPIGLDGRGDCWSLKMYLRLEDKPAAQKQAVLGEISRFAPGMLSIDAADLRMVGLVLDDAGLHTVKAYVAARPTGCAAPGFPSRLAADHPLVILAGDRALATLDLWCRGTPRANKWDFNLRDHYLAGDAAERLVAEIASPQSAAQLRPLLVGPTYRADVVAVGVRDGVLAMYMELN
jgi:hypothetical protein